MWGLAPTHDDHLNQQCQAFHSLRLKGVAVYSAVIAACEELQLLEMFKDALGCIIVWEALPEGHPVQDLEACIDENGRRKLGQKYAAASNRSFLKLVWNFRYLRSPQKMFRIQC